MWFIVRRKDFVGETTLFRPSDGATFRRWFSFLTSRCGKLVILLFWLVLCINGLIWAPELVFHTNISSTSPSGTKGATARSKFRDEFHSLATTKYMSVLFHCVTEECKSGSIGITDETIQLQNITDEVKKYIRHYNDTEWPYFRNFHNYYDDSNKCRRYASTEAEAEDCISKQYNSFIGGEDGRNDTALMAVGYRNHFTPERRADLVDYLDDVMKKVYHHHEETVELRFTSQFALLDDAQHHSANSILAHALSLPIILIIFCIGVSSWRPSFVPILNSIVSIAVSFSIVYPFALYVGRFNSMTPDLMAVVCVALTIDYDLFFFTIFYEELGLDFQSGIIHVRTLHSVLRKTLRRSSKVIGMSSSILCLSVLMYLLCDYGFLITYGCGLIVAILCAVCINVSLTPALVLCIPGFFIEKSLGCDCARVVDDESIAPGPSGLSRVIDDDYYYDENDPYYHDNDPNRNTANQRPSYLSAGGSAPMDSDVEMPEDSTPLIASSALRSAATQDGDDGDKRATIDGAPAGLAESADRADDGDLPADAGAGTQSSQDSRHRKKGSSQGSKMSGFTSFGGYNSEESGSSEDFTGLAVPKQSLVNGGGMDPSPTPASSSMSGSMMNPQIAMAAEKSAHTAAELSRMDLETRARLRGRRLEYHPFGRGEEDSTLGMINKGCYKVGVISTLFPCTVVFVLVIFSVLTWLMVVFAVEYRVDYDQNLVLPFDGDHVKSFHKLSDYYWPGKSVPWRVLIPVPKNHKGEYVWDTVYNYSFIQDTVQIWKNVRGEMDSNDTKEYYNFVNLNGLSVVSNEYIESEQEWNVYMNDDLYHAFFDEYGVSDSSNGTYISKFSNFAIDSWTDPFGRHSADFLKKLRSLLNKYSGSRYTPSNYAYKCYVYGDSVGAIDTIDRIYEYFPYMIAAGMVLCFIVSGFVFNNKWLPLRYAVTIALPLLAVYGFAVGVYQNGWLSGFNSRAVSKQGGISWIIPLMTASLMFGLALDYDMYLSERIREHTRKGDEVRTAIVKSVYESGSVISSAALIMAAAMSPLLFWNQTTGLNQAALIVIVSVVFDTIIVRPIFAPALITLTDSSAESWIIDPCFHMFCLDEDRNERWRVLLKFDWLTNEPRVEMVSANPDFSIAGHSEAGAASSQDERPLMGSRL